MCQGRTVGVLRWNCTCFGGREPCCLDWSRYVGFLLQSSDESSWNEISIETTCRHRTFPKFYDIPAFFFGNIYNPFYCIFEQQEKFGWKPLNRPSNLWIRQGPLQMRSITIGGSIYDAGMVWRFHVCWRTWFFGTWEVVDSRGSCCGCPGSLF